ncbi:hypothetical protein CEXT_77021 [Caerostris extrusa]|uniref:Uncharacterized protein n=1 Tax=Caerostris extrusa TaxID=172846 RepID=A0AAV4QXP2_CAEEX|nr:hypothetical protein CEXT_77021 [Caerostris extrusa]
MSGVSVDPTLPEAASSEEPMVRSPRQPIGQTILCIICQTTWRHANRMTAYRIAPLQTGAYLGDGFAISEWVFVSLQSVFDLDLMKLV